MFLRLENDDVSTRERIRTVDEKINSLQSRLGTEVKPENAQIALELAAVFCWRGFNRKTHDLLLPITESDLDWKLRFEARQLIADNYFRHDQYDLAHGFYERNLEEALGVGDVLRTAKARDGIAWVLVDVGHYSSGEFEEAQRIFEETLPLHHENGSIVSEGMGLYGLSRTTAGTGNYETALVFAHRSIEFLKSHSYDSLIQLPLLQVANIHRDRGCHEDALPFYRAAVDAADRSQDPYLQVLTAYHFGWLHQFRGDFDLADGMWRMVLPWIGQLEFPRLGSEICSSLSSLSAQRGNYEEAYRLRIDSLKLGNQVGVLSPILQNQQLLLRGAMDRTRQLDEELSYLTAGVEASEDGIFVFGEPGSGPFGPDFLIQFANQSAAIMMGKSPIAITHTLLSSIWNPIDGIELLEVSEKVYRTGVRQTLNPVSLSFRQGKPKWYSIKIAKIPDGIVWNISDETELETMRQEILGQRDRLEVANARLIALDRDKSEVLSIAAHDLRSPIGNIRALCDLITPQAMQASDALSLIRSSSDTLLQLIDDLLDLERIEKGKLELTMVHLDGQKMLKETIAPFLIPAHQKDIKILLEGCPISVLADKSALQRVVQNLVSNAIKFSPTGSTITIISACSGKCARIEIQDQGPGISEGDRKHVFSKFARLSARPTGGERSSGLGLSIMKNLVEAMNGAVGFHSIPGQGATFWFELPSE